MNFSDALDQLKAGCRVCRSGWNGKGMWLQLVEQWSCGEMGASIPYLPFIAMKTADNKFVPWLASQTDILANDWMIL